LSKALFKELGRLLGRVGRSTAKPPAAVFQRRLLCEPLECRRLLSLGTSVLVEGPAAGGDSDIVKLAGSWTATANASWLHTSSSGTGNGLATLTFDTNTGATRSGTLTIAGETVTVTQAGSSYVAANSLTTLVPSGISWPQGVAVDGSRSGTSRRSR
jgi:hypothetical protein